MGKGKWLIKTFHPEPDLRSEHQVLFLKVKCDGAGSLGEHLCPEINLSRARLQGGRAVRAGN